MKKTYLFLLLVLAIVICACTIPSEIQVKGSVPNLKIEQNIDLSQMFKDMVSDSFGGEGENLTMLECANSQITTQTYLVHMLAIDNDEYELDFSTANQITVGDTTYTIDGAGQLQNDIVLYDSANGSGASITLPLSNFGEILTGFAFDSTKIKAMLFLKSKDDIVKSADIKLKFVEDTDINPATFPQGPFKVANINGSGINFSEDTYKNSSLPAHGTLINDFSEILNKKKDFKIEIEVKLTTGTTISDTLFNNDDVIDITAELVIWLPMDLIAVENNAEISFPDAFGDVGDFIDSISEYMESLYLAVIMDKNPFKEGTLVMKQDGKLEVRNDLKADSLVFDIKKDDMKKIKDLGGGFNPEIGIVFSKNKHIIFPPKFEIKSISFSAKFSYMIMGDM